MNWSLGKPELRIWRQHRRAPSLVQLTPLHCRRSHSSQKLSIFSWLKGTKLTQNKNQVKIEVGPLDAGNLIRVLTTAGVSQTYCDQNTRSCNTGGLRSLWPKKCLRRKKRTLLQNYLMATCYSVPPRWQTLLTRKKKLIFQNCEICLGLNRLTFEKWTFNDPFGLVPERPSTYMGCSKRFWICECLFTF